MKRDTDALVLGLCPNGLGVFRSLNKVGLKGVGLSYRKNELGRFSKYSNTIDIPDPEKEPELVLSMLKGIGKRINKKASIYPTTDEFVIFLSRYRNDLEPFYLLSMPDEKIVEGLIDKQWQYEVARKNGLKIPDTYYPQNFKDLESIKTKLSYPLIVKPSYTYNWKKHYPDKKGFVAKSYKHLCNIMEDIFSKKIGVILQAVVQGPTQNLYEVCGYFDKNSLPLATFVKRKIRQFPIDMGLGSYMVSVENKELVQLTTDFLRKMNFKGMAEIEFKKDNTDGLFKMIEINARITLQNRLADICGINFPYIQYLDLIGEPKRVNSYKIGRSWVWTEIDYESYKVLNSKMSIYFFKWLRSVISADQYAVFAWHDLKPSVMFWIHFLKRKLGIFRF